MVNNSLSTTVSDVKILKLHVHRRKPDDGITIVSVQIKNLKLNFESSPEIYHLFYSKLSDKSIIRGGHAHIFKQEIFSIINGNVELTVIDNKNTKIFNISDCDRSIYIPAGIWHEVKFSDNAILQVISSTLYSDNERKNDYLETKDDYLKWKNSLSH